MTTRPDQTRHHRHRGQQLLAVIFAMGMICPVNGFAFDGDPRRDGFRTNGMVLYGDRLAFLCEDTVGAKAIFPSSGGFQTDGFLCSATAGRVVNLPDSLEIRNATDRTLGICDARDRCVHVFRSSIDSLTYAKDPDPGPTPNRKPWPQETISKNRYQLIALGVTWGVIIAAYLLVRNVDLHFLKMPDP